MSTSISEHARQEEEPSCWACGNQDPPRPDGSCQHCNQNAAFPGSAMVPPLNAVAKEGIERLEPVVIYEMAGCATIEMERDELGGYVRHEDHLKAIDSATAAKDEELKEACAKFDLLAETAQEGVRQLIALQARVRELEDYIATATARP